MRRRAFAMPLVLIVLVVLGLGVTVMLSRSGADHLTAARRVEAYRAEHVARGIRELLDAGLRTIRPEQLAAGTSPGAWREVLVVALDDGTVLRASMRDRQGGILTVFDGLTGDALQEASRIAEAYGLRVGIDELDPLVGAFGVTGELRVVGPPEVSVWTASEGVLAAVGEAVSEDRRRGADFAAEIIRARDQGSLSRASIVQAANTAGFPATQHAALLRLVTDRPTVWEVLVRVEAGVGGSVLGERLASRASRDGETPEPEQYRALMMLPRRGGQNVGQAMHEQSVLLTWERVEPGTPGFDEVLGLEAAPGGVPGRGVGTGVGGGR